MLSSARTRLLVLSMLIAAGASLAAAGPAAAAAPLATGVVTIGGVFSETGAGAPYGPSQSKGALLAVQQVNATGGVSGSSMTLDLRDDHSVPADAAAEFRSLVKDNGAVALLGPTLSSAALVADPEAQALGVPVLGISNTIDDLTHIGPNVFRNSLAESKVQPKTVRVAKKRFGLKRVAIVWATPDTYSAAGHAVFREALVKQHVKVVADRSFESTTPSTMRAALKAIARAKPDALVISALQGDAAKVMIDARTRTHLKKVPFIGGNAFNAPGLYAQTNGAAEGAVSGTAWVASAGTPGNAAFVAAYEAAFSQAPDQFAAQAFAGVWTIATAMRNATRYHGASLRDALAATKKLPTVLGSFSFDANRDPLYAPAVVVNRRGRQLPIG